MSEETTALVEIEDTKYEELDDAGRPTGGWYYRPDLTRIRAITTTCTLGHVIALKIAVEGGYAIISDGCMICEHPSEEWMRWFEAKIPEAVGHDWNKAINEGGWGDYTACHKPVIRRKIMGLPEPCIPSA